MNNNTLILRDKATNQRLIKLLIQSLDTMDVNLPTHGIFTYLTFFFIVTKDDVNIIVQNM